MGRRWKDYAFITLKGIAMGAADVVPGVSGGTIEDGESAEQAVVREIREELATEIRAERKLCTVEYDYPAFHLTMECFLCSIVSGKLTLLEHENAAWLSEEKLKSVKWLPADVEVLENLKELF